MPTDDPGVDHDADVAVVGAGPAGAAAALAVLAARPGARVVLLDRAVFPRDKSCGDGVAPQVLDVLARLGVSGLLDDWPTIDRLELGYPGGPWLAGRTARPNRVVPRRVLDARLVDAAVARGATLLRRRVRSIMVPEGGDPSVPDEPVVAGVRARVVVGADGAHSAVRAALGPAGGGATAIALRGYAPVTPRLAHAQVIAFDPLGSWPAYAWSFPVGDGSANVGYGEILAAEGAGAHPRAPARPARGPAAGRVGRCRRLEGPPPAAVDGALASAGRPRAARGRRARPGQPPDGRGHPCRRCSAVRSQASPRPRPCAPAVPRTPGSATGRRCGPASAGTSATCPCSPGRPAPGQAASPPGAGGREGRGRRLVGAGPRRGAARPAGVRRPHRAGAGRGAPDAADRPGAAGAAAADGAEPGGRAP